MFCLSCTVTDFGLWVMPLTCYSLFFGFQGVWEHTGELLISYTLGPMS